MSEELRWRVLYPDGTYTRLLSRREAEPLFQLWGTELLEMRGESKERKRQLVIAAYKEKLNA